MKSKPLLLLLAAFVLLTGISAHAEEAGRPPRERRPRPPRGETRTPAQGLQLSGGLQTASLQASASLAPRRTDEEWRQLFPQKQKPRE